MKRILLYSLLIITASTGQINGSGDTNGFWENISSYLFSKQPSFERGPGFWSTKDSNSFFDKLTEPQSQRENWYAVSPYIAEFWCTLSNAGFIYVGLKEKSPELLFAGCASIASHAIPKQWLLYVDKLGVLVILSKAIREYATLKSNPKLLLYLGALGLINGTDAYLARNNNLTWPHAVWHLSSAYIASNLLQKIKT